MSAEFKDDRMIHALHVDGSTVITVKVPGGGGFIGYRWTPSGGITFGHGVTREEALLEVADKIRRRRALIHGGGGKS